MGAHMKTTVEISDGLLRQAKAAARREGVTLRTLIEAGLRAVLQERRARTAPFVLRDASFRGDGVSPEFASERWDDVRDVIYEGRGT